MSAPSVTAVVYDRTNTTAVASGDLVVVNTGGTTSHWAMVDASARRKLNAPGDGSVTVPLDHPNVAALAPRNVVRVLENGVTVKAFTVEKVDDVKLDKEPARKLRQASGDGLLSRLAEMLRLGSVPIAEYPQSQTRRYDWAAPETPVTAWSSTVHVQPRDTLLWGSNRPVAWPVPIYPSSSIGFSWIHALSPAVAHPVGNTYWHRVFNMAAAGEVAFFITASDEFTLCVDGTELDAQKLQGPNSVWWYTWTAGARLAAGNHTIRIKAVTVNGTGAAGVIVDVHNTSGTGITTAICGTGAGAPGAIDGDWKVLHQPATAPGMTAGHIIRLGIAAAATRGCQVPTLNFSDTLDSAGATLVTIPDFAHRVPFTELDVLKALEPWVDFSMSDVGFVLSIRNKTPGLGVASSAVLAEGTNLTYLASHAVA